MRVGWICSLCKTWATGDLCPKCHCGRKGATHLMMFPLLTDPSWEPLYQKALVEALARLGQNWGHLARIAAGQARRHQAIIREAEEIV
jgi:hypothetical protein